MARDLGLFTVALLGCAMPSQCLFFSDHACRSSSENHSDCTSQAVVREIGHVLLELDLALATPSRTKGETPSQRKPHMFVHVHKSAGTLACAWARMMNETVPSESIANTLCCGTDRLDDCGQPAQHDVSPSLPRVGLTCSQRAQVLEGLTWNSIEHELCAGDLCFEEFTYGTIIRETISRIHSQVNFEGPWHLRGVIDCIQTSNASACPYPDSWEKDRKRNYLYIDNFLTRIFGGCDAMNAPPGGLNRTHFERALATLKRMDYVIPQDNITSPKAQALMDGVLGWHMEPTPYFVPWHPHASNLSFSEDLDEALRQVNYFDIALTDWAFRGW